MLVVLTIDNSRAGRPCLDCLVDIHVVVYLKRLIYYVYCDFKIDPDMQFKNSKNNTVFLPLIRRGIRA